MKKILTALCLSALVIAISYTRTAVTKTSRSCLSRLTKKTYLASKK